MEYSTPCRGDAAMLTAVKKKKPKLMASKASSIRKGRIRAVSIRLWPCYLLARARNRFARRVGSVIRRMAFLPTLLTGAYICKSQCGVVGQFAVVEAIPKRGIA